ncbi:hypothetical protein ASD21_13530 [Caulobacter sp. Root1455]|uniref:hypothetical protein n=1 Tax=unclassified Caulobacter TaxID=2648921 RepID=UPI0006F7052C|nr:MULTISPECIES: hypothetical protein [unclassified Caulobacter]KQY30121.1 hypothetical protein ASD38_12590 [Caulobacter sp. Root487D2Y]KQY92421.1 hypothetical protein ASD21_13530 [Caulobacter sp. Root1455]
MSELWRLLLLVTLSASAVTFVGSAAIWFMDEERRLRRALRHVLKGAPETVIVAKGRGRGAGFNFTTNQAAVAWDSGAWCLIYRIDELMGAELAVDGQVIGRVFRGEPRRAIDQIVQQAAQVTLKLIFDDPRHPDFELDLWLEGDQQRRESRSPADAIQEANRWLLRADAIVRRPLAPKAKAAQPEPAIQSRPPAAEPDPAPKPYTPALEAVSAAPRARPTATAPLFDEIDTTADPMEAPWDDDQDDDPPPVPEKTYKPVSKAARPPRNDQDELPFDLDD